MAILRIGVIADIHAGQADSPEETWQGLYHPSEGASLARLAVERLLNEQVDALFVLGDSANGGDHASMIEAIEAVSGLPNPVWIVAGNVDLRLEQNVLEDALDASSSGLKIPVLAGESFGNLVVSGLRYQGPADDEIAVEARPDLSDWVERPVLLISHYPVISRKREALAERRRYSGDAIGLDRFGDELASRPAPIVVFHGHLHLDDAVAAGSLLQLGFPALIEDGHRVAIVTIETNPGILRVEITPIVVVDHGEPPAAIGAPLRHWRFDDNSWLSF